MTGKPDRLLDERARKPWLRKLDRATAAHEASRQHLDELVADARNAGVPLVAIAEHTPYSREWARRIADKVDQDRQAQESNDS